MSALEIAINNYMYSDEYYEDLSTSCINTKDLKNIKELQYSVIQHNCDKNLASELERLTLDLLAESDLVNFILGFRYAFKISKELHELLGGVFNE